MKPKNSQPDISNQAPKPLLSIVVTSYTMNRFKDICELLDSIRTQSLLESEVPSPKSPDIGPRTLDIGRLLEVIFVAERSKELYEKVKQFISQQSAVSSRQSAPNALPRNSRLSTNDYRLTTKVLWNDGEPGLSAARNLGIAEAKGEVIAFVDDDVVLFPDWAEEMVKAYDDDCIIGVTGPAFPLWEDKKMSWFPEEFYWIVSCTAWADWKEKTEVRNAWGMNMSFRREAFEQCGPFLNEFGYHKGPMAEDNEFSLRVRVQTGKRIIYCPTVTLWHRVHKYRLSRQFIRERAYWIGHSHCMLKKLYPQAAANKMDLLSQEHQLLKRIITRLPPGILKGFFTNPVTAWRKLSITITALFFVTSGYYSHLLPKPFRRQA